MVVTVELFCYSALEVGGLEEWPLPFLVVWATILVDPGVG